jgi:hypothetical protein
MGRFEKGKLEFSDDFQRARFDFGGPPIREIGFLDISVVPLFLNIRMRTSCPPEDVCHTLGEERIFQWREPYTRSGASGVGGEENDCKDGAP